MSGFSTTAHTMNITGAAANTISQCVSGGSTGSSGPTKLPAKYDCVTWAGPYACTKLITRMLMDITAMNGSACMLMDNISTVYNRNIFDRQLDQRMFYDQTFFQT